MAARGACNRIELAARVLEQLTLDRAGSGGLGRALGVLKKELDADAALLAMRRPWLDEGKAALWHAGLTLRGRARSRLGQELVDVKRPAVLTGDAAPASLAGSLGTNGGLALVPIRSGRERLGALTLLFARRTPHAALLGDLAATVPAFSLYVARIAAVERLRASRRSYRRLVEGVSSIIMRLDKRGVIRFVNGYAERFFGYERAELVGRSVIGTIVETTADPEGDMNALMDDVQRHPDRYLHSEMQHRRRDGTTAWIRWANTPVLDDKGHLVEILSVGDDISEHKKLEEELLELATTDPMTHVFNRRKLFDELSRELARAERYGRALSVLMVDLDHFKAVNDRHGHDVGDAVLVHLVSHFRAQLRDEDMIGRLGGEEFAVLLPETSGAQAAAVAERLRRFEGAPPPVPYTLSVGVAALRRGESVDQLLKRADDALYRAKRAGRDAVARALDEDEDMP